MTDDSELLSKALNRIHALEKAVAILAEAMEDAQPGLAVKARRQIEDWAARDTTVAMIDPVEREAVADSIGTLFSGRRLSES